MKKTAQTLLTAAIFATALGSSAQSRMQQPVRALDDPIAEIETGMAVVYGPPSMFTTEPPEETTVRTRRTGRTQTAKGTTYTETTNTVPVPVYGPPPVAFAGDTNWDGRADARDLSYIKNAVLEGMDPQNSYAAHLADVNLDGVLDKEDVRIFIEERLGIPKQEPAVTTTVPGTTVPDGTTIATRRTMHTRSTRETEGLITGLLPFTDTGAVALYGPPRTGDWDLIRDTAEMESVFSALSENKRQNEKTTKTETVGEADGNSVS